MKNIKRKNSFMFSVFLTIVFLSFCGCEASYNINIIIENQTDQTLTIYEGFRYPSGIIEYSHEKKVVNPGYSITIEFSEDYSVLPIRAYNQQGEIVFSENFTSGNMIKIDKKTYKAVIPPLK